MLNEKKADLLVALTVFIAAFLVYFSTMAPTVSWWDCGELIAASHILGNPHPPGNPFFTILARAFIVAVPFAEAAARVNFVSVLTMALTAMMSALFIIKALRLAFGHEKLNRVALYGGALVGGFLVAFSDTIWFSAVEAEAYGAAMLFMMVVSWLSLHWYQHRGTPVADRTLLLMVFIGFLGVGIHQFALVTLPAVGLFMLLDKDTRKNLPLLFAGLMVFSIVYDIGDFIFYALAVIVVSGIGWLVAKAPEWRRRWSLATMVGVVAILGFSSYAYVPLRTKVNVSLDEVESRSWPVFKEYLERKQYGSESMIRRAFHRRGHLQHQILIHPHMGYGGYMLAQYFPWKVGDRDAESAESVVRTVFGKELRFRAMYETLADSPRTQLLLFLLLQIPFLYGGWRVFRRNRMVGAYLLVLYVATSYGLIFYMNFADGTQMELRDYQFWKSTGFDAQQKPPSVHMEVRERDYFYTPGFIYMGILFGVAAAVLLNWIAARRRLLLNPAAGLLAVVAFAVPVWANYKEHDRTGDYTPYDYAYNLLNSCRPNSILFTNGDNDTFPLWFLQEVEGIRKDVRVVNLSLVNTNWYMHQLYDHEPKLRIGFTPEEIDALQPQPWRFRGPVEISIPGTKIRYQLEPLPYLRVQDIMVLHIVQNNFPERPVHFATTIGNNNAMGLDQFTIMEGMVYTLVEERLNREIDVKATAYLMDSVYRFRGLGDPELHIDNNTAGLLTNYSATNFRLAAWAQDSLAKIMPRLATARGAERAALEAQRDSMVAFGERYLRKNASILPGEWRTHYFAGQFYQAAGMIDKMDSAYAVGVQERGSSARIFAMNLVQSYLNQGRGDDARNLLADMVGRFPEDLELTLGLSELHQQAGDNAAASKVLADWATRNPRHQYAEPVRQQAQQIGRMQGAPSAPPAAPSGE